MWPPSCSKLSVAAAGRARTRYTPLGRSSCSRATSRNLRLSRFLTTALPTRLGIAKAKTARWGEEAGSQEIVMGPDRAVLALRSRSKVERPGVFHVKLPGGAGPSGGAL